MQYYFNKYYATPDYTKDSMKLMDSYIKLTQQSELIKDDYTCIDLLNRQINMMKMMGKKKFELENVEEREIIENYFKSFN